MTVAELIAALQQIEDQTKTVLAEGCDCINPAVGVSVDPELGNAVLIEVRL